MRAIACSVVCCVCVNAMAAGAMGHNAIGSIVVDRILKGTYAAPPELREALKNPAVRQAFLGGAVGPDLFPTKTHRGNQSEFSQNMVDNAWKQFRSAGNEAEKAKAAESLAFAYGWLCHSAVDIDVHPKINGIVGDTYDYNNSGEKATHAALEAQLYAYLRRVAGIKDPFEARFPSDFIAEQMGLDPGDVKRAISRIRIIAAAEIAASNQVKLTDRQLKDAWSLFIQEGMADTRRFIENPENFKNWDLDCGKISTEDFEWLRNAIMELNGGKLPANWGTRYMDLWNKVKDLPPGDRAARLAELFGATGAAGAKTTGAGSAALAFAKSLASRNLNVRIRVGGTWVFPTRMAYPENTIKWDGAKFSVSLKFEEYPYTKDVTIEGEVGDGEIAWVKVRSDDSLQGTPTTFHHVLEAKHIPSIPSGLYDEYVGDTTFAAFNDSQAPGFSGSLRIDERSYIWDRTTAKEWNTQVGKTPVVVVRFREKKFGR